MPVPDIELVSSWEEVDEAAQSIKNGVQKEQLAAGVRASLDKADDAVQVEQQRAATDWDTEEAGIDENGKIVTRPSMSDEAKYSLLNLLSDVAYATPNGAALLADLEDKLFPIRRLSSITADYQQDHAIYNTDTLDAIKTGDDLTVTAHYSDGTSEVLDDDDFTLSGTLTVGTNTVTVTYEGKTASISVLVIARYLFSLENGMLIKYTGSTSGAVSGYEHDILADMANTRRRSFPMQNGVRPYLNMSTHEELPYYPIPVPPDAIKAKISITPCHAVPRRVHVYLRFECGIYKTSRPRMEARLVHAHIYRRGI